MTTVFGEVAADYERLRPGYPTSIAAALTDYLGPTTSLVAEIGAGTGKATAVFVQIGAALLCVEPDPRMAAHLTAKYPQARVITSDFESWTPPDGGVPVLAGALVWHLLDEERRCAKAHSVLRPDGVIAMIGRAYGCADPRQAAGLAQAFGEHGCGATARPAGWIRDDLAASGLFTDVTLSRHDTVHPFTCAQYLTLVTTFSPVRRLPHDQRDGLLAALREVIEKTGGVVHLELQTTLNLARRPHS